MSTASEYLKYLETQRRLEKGKDPLPPGPPTCQYIFRQGTRVGEVCGVTVRDGGRFCAACRKKKGKYLLHPTYCEYVFTRGPRGGQTCGATIHDGGRFCRGCRGKKSVVWEMEDSQELPSVPEAVT